ncbi:MAG: hypothetical protein GF364_22445 [Candidatus Lokiarchaeota archaeon]|nr:hypothetical protein [Candidatus Lokiarchaeota archaeon]
MGFIKYAFYFILILFFGTAFSVNPLLFFIFLTIGVVIYMKVKKYGNNQSLYSPYYRGGKNRSSKQSMVDPNNYLSWQSALEFINIKNSHQVKRDLAKFRYNPSYNDFIEKYTILFYDNPKIIPKRFDKTLVKHKKNTTLYEFIEILYTNGLYKEISMHLISLILKRAQFLLKNIDPALYEEIRQIEKPSVILKHLGIIIQEKTSGIVEVFQKKSRMLSIVERRLLTNNTSLITKKRDWLLLLKIYYMLKTFNPTVLDFKPEQKEKPKITAKTKKPKENEFNITSLPKNIQYLSPFIRLMKQKKQNSSLRSKFFSKNQDSVQIPEELEPFVIEYLEDSINDTYGKIADNLDNTGDLNEAVIESKKLAHSKKFLEDFNIELATSKFQRNIKKYHLNMFLTYVSIIFMVIASIILLQLIYIPQALSEILIWTSVFLCPGILSFYMKYH